MHDFLTHHKKALYTITALMAGVLILSIIAAYMSTRTVPTDTKIPTEPMAVEKPINLNLAPASTTVKVGQEVSFSIEPVVEGKPSGLDLLLTYDPAFLAFVDVQNVPQGYMKARALSQGNRIIISIIEQLGSTEASSPASLGTVVFRAKQTGQTSLAPILNTTATSSILLVGQNPQNQLTGITSPSITITQ